MGVKITTIATQKRNPLDFLNREINLFPQFNLKKKQAFYNDLYLLFHSGLDMKRVLELIVEEQKNKKDKIILKTIYDSVLTGTSLSEALSQHKDFTEYEIFSVKIGEESGMLTDVLQHLKTHFQKKIEQKRLVASALSYPITVLCIAIAAVTFMIGFVVPTFADTYKTFDAELPAITQGLIDFSNSFGIYASVFFSSIVGITILYMLYKKNNNVRKWKAKLLLSIPFLGKIIQLSKLTQFCENMNLLTSSKTSLIEALSLTSRMIDFHPLQVGLNDAKEKVMNGLSLSDSLKAHSIFPSRMVYLIAVGEEVNKLENIFKQLSELYGTELEHKSKLMGTILEPLLLVFIGALVGFIVIALYMPMFSISELI